MSISISQIVQIRPGVVGTGSNPLALNGLILTPSEEVPSNSLKTCYSLEEVADFFGSASDEYKAAARYFGGSNIRGALTPNALFFTRYKEAATGASAKGTSLAGITLAELQAVSGSLSVTIDGTAYNAESLSLGDVASFTAAAQAIQSALSLAEGQSVAWDSSFSRFEIYSGSTGVTSTISPVTGTAASALGLVDATLSQGAGEITPAEAAEKATELSLNWATLAILFDSGVTAETKLQHSQSLARWQATKFHRYFFIAWDDDANAAVDGATGTLGQWILDGKYNVLPVFNSPEIAAFVMGMVASINWNMTNGRAAFAFKTQEGLEPSVDTLAKAEALLAKGYSYYGAYAADGPLNTYNIFYDGRLSGEWEWADSYVNQIFLNAQLRAAMIDMLMGVNTLPYNDLGKTQIRAAALGPIMQALNNGTIRTGITLSESQKLQVQAMVGEDVSGELYTNGYYFYIGEATTQTRGQRQSPPIYLFYCDGGSIQKITIPSIAIL